MALAAAGDTDMLSESELEEEEGEDGEGEDGVGGYMGPAQSELRESVQKLSQAMAQSLDEEKEKDKARGAPSPSAEDEKSYQAARSKPCASGNEKHYGKVGAGALARRSLVHSSCTLSTVLPSLMPSPNAIITDGGMVGSA